MGSDGGVFAFGDAGFFGSVGRDHLAGPVSGIAPTPDGGGYWLVGADGGVFAYGDAAFFGSAAGLPPVGPVVGLAPPPTAVATGWSGPTAGSSPTATPPSSARPPACPRRPRWWASPPRSTAGAPQSPTGRSSASLPVSQGRPAAARSVHLARSSPVWPSSSGVGPNRSANGRRAPVSKP